MKKISGMILNDYSINFNQASLNLTKGYMRLSEDRELFKRVCLGLEKLEQEKIPLKWIVSNLCRGCGKEVLADNFVIWVTYWQSCFAPSHKECLVEGFKSEQYECQCIDADCNDCKHFNRIKFNDGICMKFNCPEKASPRMATGHDCFEHRKVV